MTTSISVAQFRIQFGTTPERVQLLDELDSFLAQLRINFPNYRVLVYGSFLTQKLVPGDIDVLVSVNSIPEDPGFKKFTMLQELASEGVDVFTLKLRFSFGLAEPILDAESMVLEFYTRVFPGIQCKDAIELT